MRANTCRWSRPRLALLAGGDLVGDERRLVERHLIVCNACQAHLDSLRASRSALTLASQVDPAAEGPSLWPSLVRQIQESRRPAVTGEAPPWPRRLAWPLIGLAASLILAVATAFLAVRWERARVAGTPLRLIWTASATAKPRPRPATLVRPVADPPNALEAHDRSRDSIPRPSSSRRPTPRSVALPLDVDSAPHATADPLPSRSLTQ